ncbi:phosphoprotein phosphatase methylesterase 1 [Sporobolomyces koalae]|uniref:phosphoprotein phosphatase methylesterase 1 n=1 Tax=Sporobolomyces koalae TaxID=500713 RepID=UPI0031783FAE
MNRELLKARLGKLPHLPALDTPAELDPDEEEEMLDSFPTGSSTTSTVSLTSKNRRARSRQDLSPLSAEGYFAQALQVQVPVSNVYPSSIDTESSTTPVVFRVYYTAPAISTSPDDADDVQNSNGVVFVCVHGAGYSGLSYACMAKSLTGQSGGRVGVLAYDARGHGKTNMPPSQNKGEQTSMNLESMAQDLINLLKTVYPSRDEAPGLVLVGHSMGGAVVAEACNRIQSSVADVLGVTVIDVVEGTALEALSSMSTLIAAQPKVFDSREAAIGWHLDSRTINNVTSARISVPALISPLSEAQDAQAEDIEYGWTVDLAKTEPYWKGWFTGLSSKFLGCKTAKLLILAGTDRLDRDLLIGQMQGKYQLEVFPEAGHCVHEDNPERTAETLLSFWERNDRTDVLKGVKKVGEL